MSGVLESRSGLRDGYDLRDFNTGPTTYADAAFSEKIFSATGLADFSGQARVLDLMSGPGKVGLSLQEYAPQHTYYFLDLSQLQLEKIPATGEIVYRDLTLPVANHRLRADVRELPIRGKSMDVAVARYALKDLTDYEQGPTLFGIAETLKPGGRLVIADMVSPDGPDNKSWLNMHHSLKQELSGRNPLQEGFCHIPTEHGWMRVLQDAGMKVTAIDTHVSHVTTTDWVRGKQLTEVQLEQMNDDIRNAPETVKQTFNVREDGGLLMLDYPVIILQAVRSLPTQRIAA